MGMEPVVTEERIARQPTEAQGIIRLLLAKIAELEARVEEVQRQVKGKTPQNSSLPPTAPQRFRVPHRRHPFSPRTPNYTVTPPRAVNGCGREVPQT